MSFQWMKSKKTYLPLALEQNISTLLSVYAPQLLSTFCKAKQDNLGSLQPSTLTALNSTTTMETKKKFCILSSISS